MGAPVRQHTAPRATNKRIYKPTPVRGRIDDITLNAPRRDRGRYQTQSDARTSEVNARRGVDSNARRNINFLENDPILGDFMGD